MFVQVSPFNERSTETPLDVAELIVHVTFRPPVIALLLTLDGAASTVDADAVVLYPEELAALVALTR